MSAALRPRYASYLPPAYEATERSPFARLIELYETLMSGRRDAARGLFESRAPLAVLDPTLAATLAAARDISYDVATHELVYRGEMSSARRRELQELAVGVAPLNRASYLAAVDGLFAQSWRNAAPRWLLDTWAELRVGTMTPALRAALSAFPEVRFDDQTRQLTFSGSLSVLRREALDQAAVVAGLAGPALTDFQAAVALLFERAEEREEEILGLEQLLDDLQRFSDPLAAPSSRFASGYGSAGLFDADFVSFLATWVALGIHQEWPEAKKRRLIASIVPLYKKRGTLEGIRAMLEAYVDSPVTITEELGLQVAVRSTINVNTLIGGRPHEFLVEIPFGFRPAGSPPVPFNFAELDRLTDAVVEVIDLEKPVHTDYRLRYRLPGIVVGEYSTIAVDTLMWNGVIDVSPAST